MRRSVRSELAILSVVFSVPAALALAFPYEALSFRGTDGSARQDPCVAFVTLTPDAERAALRVARLSSRSAEGDVRTLVADLLFAELPKEAFPAVLSVGERSRPPVPSSLEAGLSPFVPSRRAALPVRIEKDAGDEVALPFAREDLLKLNRAKGKL